MNQMEPESTEKREVSGAFVITIGVVLFMFTIAVVAINLNLRKEIRRQVINRDAETFLLFSMMDRIGRDKANLMLEVEPWIEDNKLLTPALWGSDLAGIVALQIFDRNGSLRAKIPESLIPASLSQEDYERLKQLLPISKFHESIWLESLFEDSRYGMMEATVPLLEVIIPVYTPETKQLETILQYWIGGNSMLRELSILDRNIFTQMAVALGAGYTIILVVFIWALTRQRKINRSLYNEIGRRILAEKDALANLKEKETLLMEIHHRVKNNLSVVSSLLGLHGASVGDPNIKQVLQESRDRIYAMSAVHEALYESDSLSRIDLREYLSRIAKSIVSNYAGHDGKIKLDIKSDDISLDIRKASPLGLILNEIVTNSMKYGFVEKSTGKVYIRLKKTDSSVEVTVGDDGVGLPAGLDLNATTTLGLKLVRILAEDQLDGSIDLDNTNGARFTIRFEL